MIEVGMHVDYRTVSTEMDAKAQTREATIRSYKVTVGYTALEAADAETRRKAVAEVIAPSLKQLKGNQ